MQIVLLQSISRQPLHCSLPVGESPGDKPAVLKDELQKFALLIFSLHQESQPDPVWKLRMKKILAALMNPCYRTVSHDPAEVDQEVGAASFFNKIFEGALYFRMGNKLSHLF